MGEVRERDRQWKGTERHNGRSEGERDRERKGKEGQSGKSEREKRRGEKESRRWVDGEGVGYRRREKMR